jgi:hypothetical protein
LTKARPTRTETNFGPAGTAELVDMLSTFVEPEEFEGAIVLGRIPELEAEPDRLARAWGSKWHDPARLAVNGHDGKRGDRGHIDGDVGVAGA